MLEFQKTYSIPAQHSFVDTLAATMMQQFGNDPLTFSNILVLLPTRRAARSLREAFLRLNDGAPLLLPEMRPIGDVDEDELFLSGPAEDAPLIGALDVPPAATDLQRKAELAALISAAGQAPGAAFIDPSPEQCLRLAAELIHLIDQVHTEGLKFDDLDRLAPDLYAENWRQTLVFLEIIRAHWPEILKENGVIDAGDRRNRLIEMQTKAWRLTPPDRPVIAAGSTGSIPATASLLATVLSLPKGVLILPGLDHMLSPQAWDSVLQDDSHPQFGLARLLEKLSLNRSSVIKLEPRQIEDTPSTEKRIALLSQAFLPAAVTETWRDYKASFDVLQHVSLLTAPDQHAEATAIALTMRRALEKPEKRAALVTPDRNLARRVAGALRRWGIEIDDSAGTPLAQTAPTILLRLIAEVASKDCAPIAFMALLKHRLVTGPTQDTTPDSDIGTFRATIRLFEHRVLRGLRPGPGLLGLEEAVRRAAEEEHPPPRKPKLGLEDRDRLLNMLHWLGGILDPFLRLFDGDEHSLREYLLAHAKVAETLSGGAEGFWRGDAGEALAQLVADVEATPAMDRVVLRGNGYLGAFDALLAGRVVRPRYGAHPRLAIWGPLEARLQRADLMILGGLNETVWPPEPRSDAWMSRPMRTAFGLPSPERRIGLSAHDFQQAFGADEVLLTRAEKIEGAPTTPSRWLSRMDAVLGGHLASFLAPDEPWLAWAREIERAVPEAAPQIGRPKPCPPLEARPHRLPVTKIEVLFRDPYAIYVEYILKIRALDPLERDPGPADRGTVFHDAFERFMRDLPPGPLPPDAVEQLSSLADGAFGVLAPASAIRAFWTPRFKRAAEWFAAHETLRRPDIEQTWVEVDGRASFITPTGKFELFGKADRIDRLWSGGYTIIDYKTGAPPSKTSVTMGTAPQLPLLAALLQQNGFDTIPAGVVRQMEYWKISGGDPAGEASSALGKKAPSPDAVAELRWADLQRLIIAYSDPAQPYKATPIASEKPTFSDYRHLQRFDEWSEE